MQNGSNDEGKLLIICMHSLKTSDAIKERMNEFFCLFAAAEKWMRKNALELNFLSRHYQLAVHWNFDFV